MNLMVQRWIPILVLWLVSCGGQIDGIVFLDANGNEEADPTEQTLGNVAVTVKQDGQVYTRAVTNSRGEFSVSSRDSGYYCVEVENPRLQKEIMSQIAAGEIAAHKVVNAGRHLRVGPQVQNVLAQGQVVGKEAGVEDPQENERQPEEEENNTTEPRRKRQPRPDKRDSGLSCQEASGSNLSMNVGVQLNYEEELERIPKPLIKRYQAGESFQHMIAIPIGCTLSPLIFPADTLEVSWNDIDPDQSAILTIDPLIGRVDFRRDVLANAVILSLRVKEDLPVGEHAVQVNPQVTCPDGKILALHSVEMILVSRPQVTISQSIPPRVVAGETLDWVVTVKNNGGTDHEVTVVASPPPFNEIRIAFMGDPRCQAAGREAECAEIDLPAGETLELFFRVQFEEMDQELLVDFQTDATLHDFEDGERITATQATVSVLPAE